MNESPWAKRRERREDLCDFTFGDPQDMPIPGYVEALQRALTPRDKDWYAYKENEPEARAIVAAHLRSRRKLRFEDEDIFLTTGAFPAIAIALTDRDRPRRRGHHEHPAVVLLRVHDAGGGRRAGAGRCDARHLRS